MTTGYEFWYARLAGVEAPIDINELQCGFWLNRRKDKPPTIVAIYRDASTTYVKELNRRGEYVDLKPDEVMERWPFWASRPVSQEQWRHYEQYHRLPEEVDEVPTYDPRQRADPYELLSEQIRNASTEALGEIKGGIETALQADRAANHRDRLLELQKRAEIVRKQELAPHELALKAIRDKWRDPLAMVEAAIRFIRNALTPYLRAERDAARAAAPDAEVKVRAGTGRRRTGLRTHVSAKILDWEKATIALLDNADLRQEVQRLADKVYRSGGELAGCERVEREVAQ